MVSFFEKVKKKAWIFGWIWVLFDIILDYLQVEAYFSAGDIVWGSIAAALTGLCAFIFCCIAFHFFIKEGFSRESLKNLFVEGKRKERLSWIALFIENYPMTGLQVYILFTCLNDMVFGSHVLDKSTQNHCSAISSSTRIMIQMYLGLATSWMSIAKNLVAFEENNYKKEGQEIRIDKKLFMFLKHLIGIGARITTITLFWHGLLWPYYFWGAENLAFFILLCVSPVFLHALLLALVKFCHEKCSGKLNWKRLVSFSILGVLGNFSDSSKQISIAASVIMALSNAAILAAYYWFQRETNAHAGEFYDYRSYNYGEGAMYEHYFGEEPPTDFWKPGSFVQPTSFPYLYWESDDTYKEYYESDSYEEYTTQSDTNEHSSMKKVILSGILIATSFLLDIFWIFVLRPRI